MITLKKLKPLLPTERLNKLAIEHRVNARNQIRLPGEAVFVCLLNGLLNHEELTQRVLEETYTQMTGQHADHSSFGKRLERIPSDYFADIYDELYQKIAPQATLGQIKTLRLRWVDATLVTLSSKLLSFGLSSGTRKGSGSHRTVKTVLEVQENGLPHFLHLCKQQSESADSVALGETMTTHAKAGDLFIFDKGCEARARLRALQEKRAFFLTPHGQQGLRIYQELFCAPNPHLPSRPPQKDEAPFGVLRAELGVFASPSVAADMPSGWEDMPLVLVHGARYDSRTKKWTPMTLMSNLAYDPATQLVGGFSFEQLMELYRRRWDIEIHFKFLKQHLSYDHLTSRCENGIRVMIYMSLIAAILLIWFQRQTGIDRGWRSVKFWLAVAVRSWTEQALLEALHPLRC
jgi:transposase